jgi:hypothetical protein
MSWERGHFAFVPGTPKSRVPLGTNFDQILLEGCRRLDETSRRRHDDTRNSLEIDSDDGIRNPATNDLAHQSIA